MPTLEAFANNAKELKRYKSLLSVEKTLSEPTLLQVVRKAPQEAEMVLYGEIMLVNQLYKNNLTEKTAALMVEIIFDKCKYDTLGDVILCLKKGVAGNYGATYKTFDMDTYNQWWACYLEEKAEVRERVKRNEQKQATADMENFVYNERQIREAVAKIGKKRERDPNAVKAARDYRAKTIAERLPKEGDYKTPKGNPFRILQVKEFYATIQNTVNGQKHEIENYNLVEILGL